jgi:cystathionine beta-lyase/cystathionine gamma-synthase
LKRFGIDSTVVDVSDGEQLKAALQPNTKVVYFETPANPTLKINGVKEIADIVHAYNKDIKVVVDNTFSTPYLLQANAASQGERSEGE